MRLLRRRNPSCSTRKETARFAAFSTTISRSDRSLEACREIFAGFVDLSPTQYLILIPIKNSTAAEPMGVNQVAERLYLSGAFVTNEINKLVSDSLLEKSPHPEDGRRCNSRSPSME
ncbi:DNA-binding MarR family transcriptional regulator [Bradyrhizobium ottawaense]|uniref:MarR family transcriptional regulator n=1 Tax=Bradyrhizobium TaxID=374 RepID=UPI002162FF08|nr:MarR family transcriptional regulator [Bradyrhizobium arachidis]